ncbi:CaiB/BaiF CoA-transferase family protein [Psychrobacillus sp. OK032]|uniref:CaiB/BaiF CoA transferase family protein n=1 Tax=Psychrobacillus sp. OK032 TaxID=1884358 RepID=UPI0008D3C711|nr:CoA transferase [Psychrobacillus sp. OK032]SES45184.1 formyl-CoA transferase [Psychrobacillus sp. OK032]
MDYKKGSALEGIKILDLGRVIAAPFAAALLADMGADVIKVEIPGIGDDARDNLPKKDGESTYFMNFNRSKKGITLDLKKGKSIFLKIVKEVDIIIENFRPGVMDKLGLGYEELKKVNPGLIYASVSGFGQTGPYSKRAGYDPIAQAMSGMMSITGQPENAPLRAGASVADTMGGTNAALGILAALHYRNRTGVGQMVDISLLDSTIVSLASVSQVYLTDRTVPQRRGNGYVAGAPGGSYQCKDGFVIFLALGDSAWQKLCKTIGREELLEDERFKTNQIRVKNYLQLDELITEWTSNQTVSEVVDLLLSVGLPAGPILDMDQVYHDPHIMGDREMFTTINHPIVGKVDITNQSIKMSETSPFVRGSSPLLGEHNVEVYKSFGFSEEEIEEFKNNKII